MFEFRKSFFGSCNLRLPLFSELCPGFKPFLQPGSGWAPTGVSIDDDPDNGKGCPTKNNSSLH